MEAGKHEDVNPIGIENYERMTLASHSDFLLIFATPPGTQIIHVANFSNL